MAFTSPIVQPGVPSGSSWLDRFSGSAPAQTPPTASTAPQSSLPAGVDVLGPVLKWAGAFAAYGIVVVSLADSTEYGEAAVALAWLVAIGSFMYWYNDFDISLAGLLGQPVQLA